MIKRLYTWIVLLIMLFTVFPAWTDDAPGNGSGTSTQPETSEEPMENSEGQEEHSEDNMDDLFSDPFAAFDNESQENSEDVPEIKEDEITIGLDDFDALFSQEMIEEAPEEDESVNLAEELLESEGVIWSGSISGSVGYTLQWEDYYLNPSFREADTDSLSPSVSGSLRFNARPDKNFRVAGKLGIDTTGGFVLGGVDFSQFSFTTDDQGNFVIGQNTEEEDSSEEEDEESEEIPDQTQVALSLSVEELYSDFHWDSILFFRFGKSFIKWGKGYFWSPADILNLSAIDAEDPLAERQGPVNFSLNFPFGIHNLYTYLLLDGVVVPEHLAVAAAAEFVIGNFELGIGGFYKYDHAPRIVSTFSGSIGDVGIFGEAVVSFGSDRVFVRESLNQPEFEDPEPGEDSPDRYVALDTFQVDWLPFFSATIGAMYMNDDLNLNLTGQYFFNGEGYTDLRFEDGTSLLDNAAYLLNNSDTNGLALSAEEQGDDYEAPPALGNGDLINFGQHYLGISLMFTEIFTDDLSFSIFWLGNMSDLSGIISPNLSYRLFDKGTISIGARFTYGEAGDELTNPQALFAQDEENSPQAATFDVTFSVSLGGGIF